MKVTPCICALGQGLCAYASPLSHSNNFAPCELRILELFSNTSGYIDVLSESIVFTSWGSHRFAGRYNKTGLIYDLYGPINSMFPHPITIDIWRISGAGTPNAALEARARNGTNVLNNGESRKCTLD